MGTVQVAGEASRGQLGMWTAPPQQSEGSKRETRYCRPEPLWWERPAKGRIECSVENEVIELSRVTVRTALAYSPFISNSIACVIWPFLCSERQHTALHHSNFPSFLPSFFLPFLPSFFPSFLPSPSLQTTHNSPLWRQHQWIGTSSSLSRHHRSIASLLGATAP